jgi:hypothetical protein
MKRGGFGTHPYETILKKRVGARPTPTVHDVLWLLENLLLPLIHARP